MLLRPVHCAVGLEYLGLGVVCCGANNWGLAEVLKLFVFVVVVVVVVFVNSVNVAKARWCSSWCSRQVGTSGGVQVVCFCRCCCCDNT